MRQMPKKKRRLMAEHYLLSYSRLLDGMIMGLTALMEAAPEEMIVRVNAGYAALSGSFEPNELAALLAIAIDRLAMQGVVA